MGKGGLKLFVCMSLSREISWGLGLLAWRVHFSRKILGGQILRTDRDGRGRMWWWKR